MEVISVDRTDVCKALDFQLCNSGVCKQRCLRCNKYHYVVTLDESELDHERIINNILKQGPKLDRINSILEQQVEKRRLMENTELNAKLERKLNDAHRQLKHVQQRLDYYTTKHEEGCPYKERLR